MCSSDLQRSLICSSYSSQKKLYVGKHFCNQKMRLLNTSTIQFREFHGSQVPYYAILSHTWGEEEVSFEEMQDGKGKDKAEYKKIARLLCFGGQ